MSYGTECGTCGHTRSREEPDKCMGYLPGVLYACCGHGVDRPYVMVEGRTTFRGDEARYLLETAGVQVPPSPRT